MGATESKPKTANSTEFIVDAFIHHIITPLLSGNDITIPTEIFKLIHLFYKSKKVDFMIKSAEDICYAMDVNKSKLTKLQLPSSKGNKKVTLDRWDKFYHMAHASGKNIHNKYPIHCFKDQTSLSKS